MSDSLMTSRRFAPLFWCQFFSAFNDNFLKNALVFLILFAPGVENRGALITLTAGVFIGPFFFLSGLGGQTADGRDATNDLTYLILDSTRALLITCPEPCIRVHANTPDRLLHHVAEVIKDGKGFPKLLNDEMVIPFYLAHGATLKEALDWNISGCCENRLINRETNVTGNGGINYGSAVEMTFRNGRLKALKDTRFGVQTGDPRSWKSYDDVWSAFCRQL